MKLDLSGGAGKGESRAGGTKAKLDGMKDSIKSKASSTSKGLDPKFKKIRPSFVEHRHDMTVLWWSILIILVSSLVLFLIVVLLNDVWTLGDYINNIFCNNIALLIVIIFLDTVVNSNKGSRKKRDEARRILRYNNLIQPDIDLYLVRKNMVITPNGKTVRKFQVDSNFKVSDMRDMYTPSELVSDVGISKIKRYGHYQEVLRHDFSKLVENVDFAYYPEIAEAAMKYLNDEVPQCNILRRGGARGRHRIRGLARRHQVHEAHGHRHDQGRTGQRQLHAGQPHDEECLLGPSDDQRPGEGRL